MRSRIVLSVAVLASSTTAWADVPIWFYPDRESFVRDFSPKSLLGSDFEEFTQDTPFRTGPLRTGEWDCLTLQQQGSGDFRNEVDVVPLRFPEEGPTTNVASLFTNADGPTEVTGIFRGGSMMAFAMDYFSAGDGEGVRMYIMAWGTTLGTVDLQAGTSGFVGFYLPSHLTTHVLFRSIRTIPGQEGEGFAIDNVLLLPFIPAPGPLALLALAGLCGLRRRR